MHDREKFYRASRSVPSGLVIGGDQPFVQHLIGVSISPMVGSIYNMGVWDKSAWVNLATRRILDGEATAPNATRRPAIAWTMGSA